MLSDFFVFVNECLHVLLVLHSVLNDLLQNSIKVVPVDALVLVKSLEVHIYHLIDLFGGFCHFVHHLFVSVVGALLALLVEIGVHHFSQGSAS